MPYLLALIGYLSVLIFALWFYSTNTGARVIYHGIGANIIDLAAIVSGLYAVYFSFLSHLKGVGMGWVFITICIGTVFSAMHLAKWIIRRRFNSIGISSVSTHHQSDQTKLDSCFIAMGEHRIIQ